MRGSRFFSFGAALIEAFDFFLVDGESHAASEGTAGVGDHAVGDRVSVVRMNAQDRSGAGEFRTLEAGEDILERDFIEVLDRKRRGGGKAEERAAALDELFEFANAGRADAAGVGGRSAQFAAAGDDAARADRGKDDDVESVGEIAGADFRVMNRAVIESESLEKPARPLPQQ